MENRFKNMAIYLIKMENEKKAENKYRRGKIYKLCSRQTDKVYIGSTYERDVRNRLAKHNRNYKAYKAGKYHYVSSFDMLEYNDCDIILLESYPCNSKQELHARERHWIEKTPNYINMKIPNRSKKESYQANKQQILSKCKEYREKHKEVIQARCSEKFRCECGGVYTRHHRPAHFRSKMHINFMESQ